MATRRNIKASIVDVKKMALRVEVFVLLRDRIFDSGDGVKFSNLFGCPTYDDFAALHNKDFTGEISAKLESLKGPHSTTLIKAMQARYNPKNRKRRHK